MASQAKSERCRDHGSDAARVASGRGLLLADGLYVQLAETFRVLADPTRAKIVYSLLHQDLCTCDLASIVNLSEPAVSQHLRLLRRLRVVKGRRSGRHVYYALDDDHMRTLLTMALEHRGHGGSQSGEGEEVANGH